MSIQKLYLIGFKSSNRYKIYSMKLSFLLIISCTCNVLVNGQRILQEPTLQLQRQDDNDFGNEPLIGNPIDDQLSKQGAQANYMYLLAPEHDKITSESFIDINQALVDKLGEYYLSNGKRINDLDEDDNDNKISNPVNDPDRFEIAYNRTDLQQLQRLRALFNDNHKMISQNQPVRQISVLDNKLNVDLAGKQDLFPENADIAVRKLIAANAIGQPIDSGNEYIDHPLILTGHQYVQGGAGEGRQLLGPDGTFENVQVVKSDNAIPSYCDPPNPCPIGYTTEDGCLEEFVNSASFSRDYQANQQCSCDNEHSLFNCAAPITTSTIKTTEDGIQEPDKSNTKMINDNDDPDNNINYDTNELDEQKQMFASNHLHEYYNENNDINTEDGTTDIIPKSKLETIARTIKYRFGGLEGVNELLDEQRKNQQDLQTWSR